MFCTLFFSVYPGKMPPSPARLGLFRAVPLCCAGMSGFAVSCCSGLLYRFELLFLALCCRSGLGYGLTVLVLLFSMFGWCVLLTAKEPKLPGFRFPGPLNDSGALPPRPPAVCRTSVEYLFCFVFLFVLLFLYGCFSSIALLR